MQANIVLEENILGLQRPVTRKKILEFEKLLSNSPKAFYGDTDKCPLKHSFADGMYVREIFIPAGTVLTGKIHKHTHPNFLLKGEVMIATEYDGIKNLKAPLSIISSAGTKRVLYCVTDTVWCTVHANPTNTKDLVELENSIVAKDYDELDEYVKSNKLVEKSITATINNCGLIALSKMQDLKCSSVSTLIALAKDNGLALTAYKVPVEEISKIALPAIIHSENHFSYIEEGEKIPDAKYTGIVLSAAKLAYPIISREECDRIYGSTFVAAGVAVVGAGVSLFASSKAASTATANTQAQINAANSQTAAAIAQQAANNKAMLEAAILGGSTPSSSSTTSSSSNVWMWVGIGAGILVLTGIIIWLAKKSPASAPIPVKK